MPVPQYGQIALSGTAQQLDAAQAAASAKAFTIKAPISNAAPARIGDSAVASGNGHFLDPGDEITYERLAQNGQPAYEGRPSDFWVIGTTGDVVTWLAFQ